MKDENDVSAEATHEREAARFSEELALVWPLLGRSIAFHRRLVDLTASAKAALLLSQAVYWTRHGRDIAPSGGWFYKTIGQWELETGLSTKEQAAARHILRRLAILEEQRLGVPAKLHFRLVAYELGALLSARIGARADCLDWEDGALVAELLGPAVSYHRSLDAVAGSVHAGLLLSRALYLTRRQLRMQGEHWFCSSASQWEEAIGLTRREQETARRSLERFGVWEEAISGIPPRVFARVKLACLLARLAEHARRTPGLGRTPAVPFLPGCGFPTNRFPQKGKPGLRQSRNLVSPKAPNQFRPNRHHSYAESAKLNIRSRSTNDLVQPPQPDGVPVDAGNALTGRGGDLIFPAEISPEEKEAARALLQRTPALAQSLLDELAARMRLNAIERSPIAYLRGMARRAEAGLFLPEIGLQIAAARKKRDEEILARAKRDEEERRLAAERANPEHQARVAEHRAKIRELLDPRRAPRARREMP